MDKYNELVENQNYMRVIHNYTDLSTDSAHPFTHAKKIALSRLDPLLFTDLTKLIVITIFLTWISIKKRRVWRNKDF